MKKVDVVIVNWNTGPYLKECVESVIKYDSDLVDKIIVVDNASTDNSIPLISEISGITLIENSGNFGFGRACNIGAKICTSEYILFLNPDARIYENTLSSCLDFLDDEKNASVGILGVPLEDTNGNIARCCARYPSIFNMVSSAMGLDKLIPSSGALMKEWDHLTTREVDQVIGAFFLVRGDVYKKLNGFDERFFVYYEEVDFSYRAKKKGYKSVYYSGARAFHYGGVSSSKAIANRLFFSLRSRVQYFYKHFNVASTLFIILTTLFIEFPARLIHAIFIIKSYTLTMETLKGYRMFLVSLFRPHSR
jgi:GT2 family glycosyltransferase